MAQEKIVGEFFHLQQSFAADKIIKVSLLFTIIVQATRGAKGAGNYVALLTPQSANNANLIAIPLNLDDNSPMIIEAPIK